MQQICAPVRFQGSALDHWRVFIDNMAMDRLDLYTLPASYDVVGTTMHQDIDAALQELREWLWQCGYTPLGPALLGWNEWAIREVRQPIAPVFAPPGSRPYQVVERPELLVAATPISIRAGTFNLAGVYDAVRHHGFDPLGAPLVPLGLPPSAATTIVQGFVPVVPRGTSSLMPLPSWYISKMGWQVPAPRLGERLSPWQAVQQTGLIMLRTLIGLILIGIILGSLVGLCGWILGIRSYSNLATLVVSSLIAFSGWGLIIGGFVSMLMIRSRLRAVRRWNSFWAQTPTPPSLQFDFQVEE